MALGKAENKEKFITEQNGKLPNIAKWKINANESPEISSTIINESKQLNTIFKNQNKSAKLKQELSDKH